jgi:hypothetical protein
MAPFRRGLRGVRLELAVTLPGADTVDVTVDLDNLEPDDTQAAVELVGIEPISALAAGEWNLDGVRALLYMALVKQLPDSDSFPFDDMALDFGALTNQFVDPDLELEASMPMLAGP